VSPAGQTADIDTADRWLPLLVVVAWLTIVVFAMANHELWRDEAEPWLLALHSGSFAELFRNVKYEGHSTLWYVSLFVLTRVTASPVAMQVLHLGIGAAIVWTFARYAPFTRLQRVLFALGYFPLYEYAVVSRDYSVGVLLLLAICAALGPRAIRFPTVVVLLALVPHTNVFAAVVGLALGLTLLVDRWLLGGPMLTKGVSRAQFAWGLAVVSISVALAAVQLKPPADSAIVVGWQPILTLDMLAKRVRTVAEPLFPIPQLDREWWTKPFLWNLWAVGPLRWPLAGATYAVLGWVAFGLARQPRALIFLATAVSGLIAFTYLKFAGEVRHLGHFFVALVMALWLGNIEDARRSGVSDGWIGRAWAFANRTLFTTLLGVHVLGGALAVLLDRRYIFSNGKATAAYLVEHGLDRAPFVAEPDYTAQSVLVYLQPKQAYFPRGERTGAFVIWNKARLAPVTDSACLDRARRLATDGGTPAVLLLNHPLAVDSTDSAGTRELARFVGSTVGDEDFYVYSVRPER